ncbi:T9SS type A sorting domain-containing protein [Flavobacteriaceae bacterium TK19130]|nr:T9SS type A sorting domain-containing protein [Thermobacterium salinum]
MKIAITLLVALMLTGVIWAQDMFTHIATSENIVNNLTVIDHPSLNDNEDAIVIITHYWNPLGGDGIYNDNVTGVFYNTSTDRWIILNQDFNNDIVEGSAYNVYVTDDSEGTIHIASEENEGPGPNVTRINDPLFNGNSEGLAFITNYFNPNEVFNDHVTAMYYDNVANRRGIFTQDVNAIPEDAAFFAVIQESGDFNFRHEATAGNTAGNSTEINHPFLNDNPDAMLVVSHYWGGLGASSEIILDAVKGVWYNEVEGRWNVYTEDFTGIEVGTVFDLLFFDPALSSDEQSLATEISVAPNPVLDVAYVSFPEGLTVENLQVFDVLGKQVISFTHEIVFNQKIAVDMSALAGGMYLLKITTDQGTITRKVLKP